MDKITHQHGDVILVKIDKLPDNAKETEVKNSFVVEKGEGIHTHVIHDTKHLKVFMSNEEMYLKVLKDLKIDHEEHGVQTITPGIYKKKIERQYDYENGVEKWVED